MSSKLIACITAYYKPQNKQTWRCSCNFATDTYGPHWDIPVGAKLRFETSMPPEGYPSPHFDIALDVRGGNDKRWNEDLYHGKSVVVTEETPGVPGIHALYVGTTSTLKDLDGSATYAVLVYIEE